MVRAALSAVFLFTLTALAIPAPQFQLNPDPAQEWRIGNGRAEQFIGGQCLSSVDCDSGCCAVLRDIGICSGPGASFQQGKEGCGFGDGATSTSTSASVPAPTPTTTPIGENGNGNGNGDGNGNRNGGDPNQGTENGRQFITGPCDSDRDCASGCCSPPARDGAPATCAARAVAEEPTGRGCGFEKSYA